jgi:hypothetical protein
MAVLLLREPMITEPGAAPGSARKVMGWLAVPAMVLYWPLFAGSQPKMTPA